MPTHYTEVHPALPNEFHVTHSEIMFYTRDNTSPNHDAWQRFRESLKGVPTMVKLVRLGQYIEAQNALHCEAATIRAMNYINALKRGGQLTREGYIQR